MVLICLEFIIMHVGYTVYGYSGTCVTWAPRYQPKVLWWWLLWDSAIAKSGPGRAQSLTNACFILLPQRLQNRDTLIEQSNILLKQSVCQLYLANLQSLAIPLLWDFTNVWIMWVFLFLSAHINRFITVLYKCITVDYPEVNS